MSTDPLASVGGKPLPRIDDEGDSLGDDFEATHLRDMAAFGAAVRRDIDSLPTTEERP